MEVLGGSVVNVRERIAPEPCPRELREDSCHRETGRMSLWGGGLGPGRLKGARGGPEGCMYIC